MSSTKVQHPVKMENPEEKLVQTERNRREMTRRATFNANNTQNKKKHENDRKFGRKRTNSNTPAKFFPPHKRRKKEEQLTLPTKFLLGGNIYDPLNLNSLQDEEINRAMNAFTPKSSPLPTPKHRKGAIEVIIPPNLHDPLNLACCDDDAEYEQQLISPFKKSSRKARTNRSKKKRNSSSGCSSVEVSLTETSTENVAEGTENSEVSATTETTAAAATTSRNLDLPLKKENTKDKSKFRNKFELKDKIVSPVIPQSRGWTRPHGHKNKHKKAEVMPTFKAKNGMFPYGNYTRYYGYRNLHHELDARLKHFTEYPSLFVDKDVLDIGCNVGHVALSVARDFAARSVVGLDIDRKLIEIARKNVRHYVNCSDSPASGGSGNVGVGRTRAKFFPISMPIVFGPLGGVAESPAARAKFPHNISFVQGNYVLDSDTLLETEQAQFDTILCLSISKWLHLNWGDAGLKQAFRRMYIQLRPGGKLILEAQSWDSYKKRKCLSETHFRNYQAIKFYPQKFNEYLMSEVGFSKMETIAVPMHRSKGFQRPIQMFTKGIFSSSYSAASTPFYVAPSGRTKAPVYTSVVVSSREPDDDDDILASALADKDDSEGDAVFASPDFEADCERFDGDKPVGDASEEGVESLGYFEAGLAGPSDFDADCESDADKEDCVAERDDAGAGFASPGFEPDCGYVDEAKDDCQMDSDGVAASPGSDCSGNKETEVYAAETEAFGEEHADWQEEGRLSSDGGEVIENETVLNGEVVENGTVLNGELSPDYDDEG